MFIGGLFLYVFNVSVAFANFVFRFDAFFIMYVVFVISGDFGEMFSVGILFEEIIKIGLNV